GFFPLVGRDEDTKRGARVGLHEMGLPYVNDPAITRHLAEFLRRHAREVQSGGAVAPEAILFNGGAFQPEGLRERAVEVMRQWYATPEKDWRPLVLTNPSLDLAVAWGAAHFAWLKHIGGKRIGGGIARSYYIGVEAGAGAAADASQGAADAFTVVCVVP